VEYSVLCLWGWPSREHGNDMIYDFEAHTTECDACLAIDKKMEIGSQLGEARLDLLVQKDRVGRHDSRLVDSAHDSNPARGFSTPPGAVCEHHQSSGKTQLPKSQPHKNIRADSKTANPCFSLKPSARRLRTPDTWSAAHRIASLGDGQLLHARGASCPGPIITAENARGSELNCAASAANCASQRSGEVRLHQPFRPSRRQSFLEP